MIVWKEWRKPFSKYGNGEWVYEGWFLFGFIPLYIKRQGAKRS